MRKQSSTVSVNNVMVPLIMLLLGFTLLYIGTEEYKIYEDNVADYVRSSPDNRTIWFLIIGTASSLGGIIGLLRQKSV